MYWVGGNHRYSLFEDLWETLGAIFGSIMGATLDANFGEKKSFKKRYFWDFNPGQNDDFHLMRLFCLSIYIRNIAYLTTGRQRLKKKTKKPLRSSERTVCCFGEGIQLNLLTLIHVSEYCPTPSPADNWRTGLVYAVAMVCLLELKQRAPAGCSPRILSCWFWFWRWTIMQYHVC